MSMMLRRRMLMRMLKPALPAGYQQIEYVERGTSVAYNSGYNALDYQLNGVDDVEVRAGIMPIATQSSSSGGYIFGCRQTTTNNTVGYGIGVDQGANRVFTFDGTACYISPNGGNSIINRRIDIVATKTSTGQTITDGTVSNSSSGTPRAMASPLYVLGIKTYSSNSGQVTFFGRLYYLKIKEGGVMKVNLIPCKDSSNHVGFYDLAQQRFFYNANYTAGPNV